MMTAGLCFLRHTDGRISCKDNMGTINSLYLRNFRNHSELYLKDIESSFIFLTGPNGAGKTNILESLSLLMPGRGFRRARIKDIQKQGTESDPYGSWTVTADVKAGHGKAVVGTGYDPVTEKRIVRIDGTASSQAEVLDYLNILWLTPFMDSLFLDASSERRRFLDRMIVAYDPSHMGRVTRYENAMAQRSKFLREDRSETAWLDSLEAQMAETGVAIAASRNDFLSRWQIKIADTICLSFPEALVCLNGMAEQALAGLPALEVEEQLKSCFRKSRKTDSVTGGAAFGPHKTDLEIVYKAKNMPAASCSTGEQKSLLINLVLGHCRLLSEERGLPPVLLLDEVAAHLDSNSRNTLFEILADMGAQVWVTGTDHTTFQVSEGRFYNLKNGILESF